MIKEYLTVSALTRYIKYKFDQDAHLKNVLLKGEISNFKHHSRGHFYFTLKDDKAQISAIMFASNSKKVPFEPQDGLSVMVEGYISVYEQGGSYQIYVNKMSEDGVGNLYLAFEQLKAKLSKEGLFDERYKKPIPRFPNTIAVLTSPTGAAVRDVINIVNRRYPLAKIIVYPTLVQGENAKYSIVEQLQKANKDSLADVIILGRGGGSIEDLWPFNEEEVAYAIFQSTIPIISSVGHETDFTISDFVADLRAPTPSGGAELAVPDKYELISLLRAYQNQLRQSLSRNLERKKEKFNQVQQNVIIRDPLRLLETKTRKLDHLDDKLRLLHPENRISQAKKDLITIESRLIEQFQSRLKEKRKQFENSIEKLELINPLALMKKGYGITKKAGKIITNIKEVQLGDDLTITMQGGSIDTQVKQIREEDHYE